MSSAQKSPQLQSELDELYAAQLDNVTKDFGSVLGLDDVTVGFRTGEVTVLLGLSGSGKSTLLRHINGLHLPTTGTVRTLGQDVAALGKRDRRTLRRRIGMIFQDFNLIGPMSVLENVCTGALGALRGPRLTLMTYPKQVRRDALKHLDRVALADRAFQRADTLSGGQQQRVAIARALMQKPEVLLADEPVASLDPISSAQVMGLLREICAEDKLTVITSLHQVQLSLDFGDRIVGLRSGQLVFDHDTEDLTAAEASTIYDQVSHVSEEELAEAEAEEAEAVTAAPREGGATV